MLAWSIKANVLLNILNKFCYTASMRQDETCSDTCIRRAFWCVRSYLNAHIIRIAAM